VLKLSLNDTTSPLLTKINEIIKYGWGSATLNTWLSVIARLSSTIVVLPLILTKLTVAEIALWYLFSTLNIIQLFVDFGFYDTFIRFISYGYAGLTEKRLLEATVLVNVEKSLDVLNPNWELIEKIWGTIQRIYLILTLITFLLYSVVGSILIYKTIIQVPFIEQSIVAWFFVIIACTVSFFGNVYVFYLNGLNKVALVARWNTFFSFIQIVFSFIALKLFGSLLILVIFSYIWMIINVIRNYALCRTIENGVFLTFKSKIFYKPIFKIIWPSAWKSAIGVFMSNIVIQASGLIVAQIDNVQAVASYLLGYRFIQIVISFSLGPFYTKIPLLTKLRAEGNITDLINIAKRGMRLSYITFIIGFIGVALFAPFFLSYIKSNTSFISPLLWLLFGYGFFIERYGAMHVQLYSTTNHIIWHIANTITGSIYIISCLLLFKYISVFAFPVSIIIGYLSFYSWYCPKLSYKSIGQSFFSFEKTVFLPSFIIFVTFSIFYVIFFTSIL